MLAEVRAGRTLYQSAVVSRVRRDLGEEFVYRNRNRNWAIVKPILDAFRKVSGDEVVWLRSRQVWRLRHPCDRPGRMQR